MVLQHNSRSATVQAALFDKRVIQYKIGKGDDMDLFRFFTECINNPAVRERVLRAIADPARDILAHYFIVGCDGCLFVLAGAVAAELPVDAFVQVRTSSEVIEHIASVLNISAQEVDKGMRMWDSMSQADHQAFRESIRAYLAEMDAKRHEVETAQMARAAAASDDQLGEMRALGARTEISSAMQGETAALHAVSGIPSKI
jgi:hypothetical protein